jgi:hypothetical protein
MQGSVTQAPRLVAWEVTRACDLACLHCRAVAQPHADPRQLSTDEAFRLVDTIATFRPPVILILTGGDPLKRPDIFTVAARASQAGLRVVMSPSGTHVTPASVAELKRAGVQRISVSLDRSASAATTSGRCRLLQAGHRVSGYARGGLPRSHHVTRPAYLTTSDGWRWTWGRDLRRQHAGPHRGGRCSGIRPEYRDPVGLRGLAAPHPVVTAPHYKRIRCRSPSAAAGTRPRRLRRTVSVAAAWRASASVSCRTSARWAAAATCRSWRATSGRRH